MPNWSGVAKLLACTTIAPATPAITEPSTNITMRTRSVGTPSVLATTSWSRPAMASRCSGERATKIVSSSTTPRAPSQSQNSRNGVSKVKPKKDGSRMPTVVSPLESVNSVHRRSTTSTISLRPRVPMAK